MATTSSQRNVRILVLAGFLLAAIVVGGVSKYTYDQVNHLSSELWEISQTNPNIDKIKDLLDSLTIVENEILIFGSQEFKTFDDSTLYDALGAIKRNKEDLDTNKLSDSWDQIYVDSVLYLVEEKFDVLDSLIQRLNFVDTFYFYDELLGNIETIRKTIERENNRVTPRRQAPPITKVDPATTPSVPLVSIEAEDKEVEKKEKQGFFARIFGRKDKKKKNQASQKGNKSDTSSENQPSSKIAEVEKSNPARTNSNLNSSSKSSVPPKRYSSSTRPNRRTLREARKIENSATAYLAKRTAALSENDSIIFSLMNKNRQIDLKIHGTVRDMEDEEAEKIGKKAENANALRSNTDQLLSSVLLAGVFLFVILLSLIFFRLSKIQQLENSLREEKAQTEKLAKAKEEFLANMSHDIRTPMNAIIGFTRQLSETSLSIRQSEFVKTIKESGRYLLGLINDILDYSKLESGNFSLDNITFSPRKIFEDVQQIYEGQAQQKNIQLETWINGDMPEALQGDPLRLKQMLFNLVNNAIKFTEKGTVSINVHSEVQEEQKVQLYIEVADTGIGIAQDKLDHIFGAYQQAELGTTSQYGGTGLGLAITQKLVESHQGKMDVESMLGQGTIFKLWLPFRIGEVENLQATAQMELDPAPLRGKRVLLADDEPFNLALLETILEKWEVNTKSVENGKHLIKQLGLGGFDYALIDLQMPEMDGFQSAKYIREELKSDIPLIALTATSTPEEMEAALEAGVDHVMLKPFDEGVLLEKMIQLGNGA